MCDQVSPRFPESLSRVRNASIPSPVATRRHWKGKGTNLLIRWFDRKLEGVFFGSLREQARSHIGFRAYTNNVFTENPLWERACSRRGRPIQHKTHSQTNKQAMFNRHLQTLTQTTQPCAVAYDYARIRRLVRLEAGLYRFRVADESAIGFSSPGHL